MGNEVTATYINLGNRLGEWSVSRTGRFTLGEWAPGTHWIGSWVVARVGLDAVAKMKNPCPCQKPNAGRPAR